MYDDNKINTKKKKATNKAPKHSETKLNFYRFKNYFNGTIPKIIILMIFVFVFIFCVSRFGKYIIEKNDHDISEFNTNMTYIENTVVKYYKKENQSSQTGTIANSTLKDLINNGIIEKDKVKNIDSCDLDESYIKLTKKSNGKYKILVSMTCDGILEEKEDVIK